MKLLLLITTVEYSLSDLDKRRKVFIESRFYKTEDNNSKTTATETTPVIATTTTTTNKEGKEMLFVYQIF